MAHVGEKRAAENQVPNDEDEVETVPPKRPTTGSRFSFRPSTLTKSTEGFLKPSNFKLEPPELVDIPGGFQPLDTEDLPSITMTTSIMTTGDGDGVRSVGSPGLGGTDQKRHGIPAGNHNDIKNKNPCPHFVPTSSSESFSSLSGSGGADGRGGATFMGNYSSPPKGQVDNGTNCTVDKDESRESETDSSVNADSFLPGSLFPFGSKPVTALLPEIQTHTGEEAEKNVVQVPGRLYVFDVVTHSWKDRGRGEVRLNDVCQSEGVFQSRIVMRTSGSYHVLLNTHLWAQMKCSRANQKSIRITAQGPQGTISVFLIMGAPKDIQQLFTATDRRLEALWRNATQEGVEGQQQEDPDLQNISFDEDDESLLDDLHSSPDSSPDPHSHARRLRQVENPVPVPEQQSVSTPDQPGSEDEDHESNKNSAAEKESPTVETESGVDATSV